MSRRESFQDESQDARRHDQTKAIHPQEKIGSKNLQEKDKKRQHKGSR